MCLFLIYLFGLRSLFSVRVFQCMHVYICIYIPFAPFAIFLFILHKARFHIPMLAMFAASATHSVSRQPASARSICVCMCARPTPFASSAVTHSRAPTVSSLSRPLYARARLPFLSLAPSDVRAGSRRAAMLIRHSRACSLPSRSCLCWHAGKHPLPDTCRFWEVRPLPVTGIHSRKLLYEHARPTQTIYRDLRFHEL